jgi:hypothetical protein
MRTQRKIMKMTQYVCVWKKIPFLDAHLCFDDSLPFTRGALEVQTLDRRYGDRSFAA